MGGTYSLIALAQWYSEGNALYGKAGYLKASTTFKPEDTEVDMKGKTIVITGANKGIGREAANVLASKGASIHLLCRDQARGEAARDEIRSSTKSDQVFLHTCDVSNFQQIREFVREFSKDHSRVDVLVHNAGVMPATKTLTSEGHEVSMATMLGGSYLLTGLLLPLLKAGAPSRVINVSSGGMYNVKARPDDLESNTIKYDGTLVYALNKRAQVILTELWAEKLKGTGVMVNGMHPGWAETEGLQTQMKDFYETKKTGFRSAAEGADTVVWMAVCERIKDVTGKFFFDRQAVRTNFPFARTDSDPAERELLWRNAASFCSADFTNS